MEQFAGLIAAGISVLVLESVHQKQRVARGVAAGGWLLCSLALPGGMLLLAALGAMIGTAALVAAKAGEREWKKRLTQEKV